MTEMIERVARAFKMALQSDLAKLPTKFTHTDERLARAAIEEIIIVLQEYGEPQAAAVLRDKALGK